MREMPGRARLFLLAMYAGGLLSAALVSALPSPPLRPLLWEFAIFVALAAVAGGAKVTLMRCRRAEEVGSMSLGFAITFAALLHFGPAGGLWVGVVSSLSSCLYPRRQPLHQLAFNVCLGGLEGLAAGGVWVAAGGRPNVVSLAAESFPSLVAACLAYYAVNTGSVATIVGLCTRQHVGRLWRDSFLWTAPSYFAAAAIAAFGVGLFGNKIGPTLLCLSPVGYLIYYSYSIYMARANEKQEHIEELQVSQAHLSDLYLATVKSLAIAIDAKDQYTHEHIIRVQRYAVATAEQMGLNGTDLKAVETGALLHDIGKLGVPEYVLLKPGRLTEEEFAKIRKHPEIGAAILDPVDFPWPVRPVVRYHHERWDGSGYPDGLRQSDIPLTARILAVADVYDALTSMRSYRQAMPHEQALAIVREDAGTHFDPQVVEAFGQIVDAVIGEMAEQGEGPLAVQSAVARSTTSSKADQAVLDIQRASSELWALYEVVQTLSCSLGTQETLNILARKLEAILPGTACAFLLRSETGDALLAREAIGVNAEFLAGCRTIDRGSVSFRVMESRTSYLGAYDANDLMLVSSRLSVWEPLRTALIVPVVHDGEALGTINVYHPQPEAFGAHEQQFLEAIAERAAMALYNCLLFDRTRGHAFTDPLTGLFNVRYLMEHVNERCRQAAEGVQQRASGDGPADLALAEADAAGTGLADGREGRASDRFALLCLDMDSFKPINDNFGHQRGDQVLADAARLFQATVRTDDVVGRYGGDEFLVVLDGAGPAEAQAMAERLQVEADCYDPGLVDPQLGPIRIGVSVGYACFPVDGREWAALLSMADSRMYADKTKRKLGRLAGAVNGNGNGHANGNGRPAVEQAEDGEVILRQAA